jgi:hypothetical protein
MPLRSSRIAVNSISSPDSTTLEAPACSPSAIFIALRYFAPEVDSEQVTVSVVDDFHAPLGTALERSIQVTHHLTARRRRLLPCCRIIGENDTFGVQGERAMADMEVIPGHATSNWCTTEHRVRFRRATMRWCHSQKPANDCVHPSPLRPIDTRRRRRERASDDIVSAPAHQWGWYDGSTPLGRTDHRAALSCLVRSAA